jgi:hypothetical protein
MLQKNNITATIENGKMTIVIDLDPKFEEESASGKSMVLAKTSGYQNFDGVALNLNVIRKKR